MQPSPSRGATSGAWLQSDGSLMTWDHQLVGHHSPWRPTCLASRLALYA